MNLMVANLYGLLQFNCMELLFYFETDLLQSKQEDSKNTLL